MPTPKLAKMPNQRNLGPKQPINKYTVKRLLKYITSKYKLIFSLVILCIIVSAVVQVIGQLFIQKLIDNYIAPLLEMENPVYTSLAHALAIMALIYAVGVICGYLYNRLMVNISQGVQKDIRDEMFSHMQKLPIRYFDEHSHGDIMSRYTNDIDTLRQMLSQSIPQFISSFLTIVAVICAMIYLNFSLTLILFVGIFFMLKVSGKIAGSSTKYFIAQQNDLGKVDGYIEEMIAGQKVVKVFTYEKEAEKQFDKINDRLYESAAHANAYANIIGPVTAQLGNLVYVIIAIVGGVISTKFSTISIGTMVSFLTLTKSFMSPINQITNQVNSIIMALAGATRIFEVMDEKEEENNGHISLVKVMQTSNGLEITDKNTGAWAWKDGEELIPLKGDVRFNEVNFSYNKEKQILHDITLYAKPGQKIAFVGATGAGKTTITNLINRFYDIDSGTITYDGINLKDINKKDLRLSLGMVLQDTNLFTGTILDNVRYGNLNATDEECIEACRLANADGFIRRLPNGYNTVLTNNGAELSQGQRQLLAIARCAVIDPPVMVLDEATSSIDTRTEKIVQEGMDKLMKGRTVFVIAHRLSTVQNANAIMVLENGVIIERGTHEDLIEQKGKYYSLYTGAFELE